MSWGISLSTLVPELLDRSQRDQALQKGTYVGLDFGTANTVASVILADGDNLVAEPIPIPQEYEDGRITNHHLVPTVVAHPKDRFLLGVGAKNLRNKLTKDKNIWFEFKMDLGVDLGPVYYQTVVPKSKGALFIETPKDATLVFLDFLRQKIEAYVKEKNLPRPIHYSVSIPASFETNQRQDLLEALKGAKLNVGLQALIDEPNAAFISCVNDVDTRGTADFQVPEDSPLNVLVFDFGAGTCDISLLEVGQSEGRFYSKNVSISRFTELGGKDLDRAIIEQVLLPNLRSEAGAEVEQLPVADLEKRVIPKLEETAESLKVKCCKSLARQTSGFRLPDSLATSEDCVTLGTSVSISTSKGRFVLEDPRLSCRELSEVMEPFLDPKPSENAKSIFEPIQSALKKAGLTTSNLDLVVLIGGSSLNPYVQKALKAHFSHTEMVMPRDPRSHVSTGAALHSFLRNGLNRNLIKPITSEAILTLTRDDQEVLILPAGTEIPCETVHIPNLVVAQAGQKVIEVPVCVGSASKVVGVIQIESSKGYDRGTTVSVECSISEDKLLEVSASVKGQRLAVSFSNPFANRALTVRERELMVAIKQANQSAASNGGRPHPKDLCALGLAYEAVKKHLEAAETLEKALELDPRLDLETEICCFYARAGRLEQSRHWARVAHEANPSSVSAYNLALEYPESSVQFRELMEEGLAEEPDAVHILAVYGRALKRQKDARGQAMLEKAYDLFLNQYEQSRHTFDRLACRHWEVVSHELRRPRGVDQARRCLEELERNPGLYSKDQLLMPGSSMTLPPRG